MTDLELAQQAARKAADVIRDFQTQKSFSVKLKAKNDLVTDADVATEEAIVKLLQSERPDDQILGEETVEGQHIPEGRVWIVDPIDGTTNFAHGFPIYCVSIALYEDGAPQAGIIYEVNNDEMFAAAKGQGATLNGSTITVSKRDTLERSLLGTGFPYNDLSLIDEYLELFRYLMSHTQGVRRPGTAAYDLACVAAGRYEAFYEYSLKPWDVAAGGLLVQEAGGVITDWDGGQQWLTGQRLVAGNRAVHAELLSVIQQHIGSEGRAAVS
ncbi:MAG: inositol monophosphatase family protein [Bacteroidota bacterium]